MKRIRFRIVRRGPKVAIQSYIAADDAEVQAGYARAGWAPLVTGFASAEEARASFGEMYGTQDIVWESAEAGTFRAFA